MTSISIIGAGNMGKALSELFTRSGAEVQLISHEEAPGTIQGEVVVLAVPYPALADVASTAGPQLDGRIVVDITNPVDFASFAPIKPAAGSAAAELAAALPKARVVKAFNTNFAASLAAGTVNSAPISVILAGDDADAKKTLSDAVIAAGAAAFDLGGLARAAELEAFGYLQIALAATEQIGWTNGFVLYK